MDRKTSKPSATPTPIAIVFHDSPAGSSVVKLTCGVVGGTLPGGFVVATGGEELIITVNKDNWIRTTLVNSPGK